MRDGSAKTDPVSRILAPHGRLRAAINFGNAVLARKDPQTGEPGGLSAAIARDIAGRLGLPLEFLPFDSAGAVSEAAGSDAWDIAFLAVDPLRAAQIAFTEPYVLIKGSYLVPADSTFQRNEDLDRPGVRIAVGKNAAYDLYLSRTLSHATLVRAPTTPGAVDLFREEGLEAAAGVRIPLLRYAKSNPDFRVLDGHFMVIRQAMGVPLAAEKSIPFLNGYLAGIRKSGFVRNELEKSGQSDAEVAP